MMLKTIWLKTIRDTWRAAVGWGVGIGILIYVSVVAYVAQYPSVAARKNALSQLGPFLNSFRFLLGDPVDISTPGGFLTFRYMGFIPVALGVWAILTTTSTRGEEQRGIGDLLLTTPHRRSNVLTQQWFGFSLALLGITLLMWLVGTVGWLKTGEPLDVTALLIASLNIGFEVWLWGSLGLLLSQFFASRGAASGVSIGLLIYMFFFNNLAGMFDWLAPFAVISPFHYYAINRPLAPGWTFDPLAFAIPPILALVFFGLALFFVNRRDVAAAYPLFGQQSGKVSTKPLNWREPLLGNIYLRNLRDLRWPTFWWTLVIAFYIVIIVATAGETVDTLRNMAKDSGSIVGQLFKANFTTQDYIASVLGQLLPVVIAAFAITHVASWTGDEENGIDDMVLTTPHQRWGVLLNRIAAIATATIVMLLIIGLMALVTANVSSVAFDVSKLIAATLQLLPFTLLVVALGFAIAAWLKQPSPAVTILSLYVILAYVLDLLVQFLKLPEPIPFLSIFHDYGTPALKGLDGWVFTGLTLGALALLALAITGFQRRDMARG